MFGVRIVIQYNSIQCAVQSQLSYLTFRLVQYLPTL